MGCLARCSRPSLQGVDFNSMLRNGVLVSCCPLKIIERMWNRVKEKENS